MILCLSCFEWIEANPLSADVVECKHCGNRNTHDYMPREYSPGFIRCDICGEKAEHPNHKHDKDHID